MDKKVLVIIAILTACLWAPVNLSIKVAMEDMTPAAIALFRWGIMSVLLWGALSMKWFRKALNVKFPNKRDSLTMVTIGLFVLGPAHAIFYNALTMTTSVESTVLNTSAPIWIGLLATLILKEQIKLNRWIAILLSGVGAYVVAIGLNSPMNQLAGGNAYGNLMYLSGVILECLSFVLATKIVAKSSGLGAAAWQYLGMAISAVILSALLPNVFENFRPIEVWEFNWKTALAIFHMAGIAGVLCFSVWYILMGRLPLSLLAICMGIEPIVGIIVGALFLGEPVETKEYIGTALIVISLIVATRDDDIHKDDKKNKDSKKKEIEAPKKALIET